MSSSSPSNIMMINVQCYDQPHVYNRKQVVKNCSNIHNMQRKWLRKGLILTVSAQSMYFMWTYRDLIRINHKRHHVLTSTSSNSPSMALRMSSTRSYMTRYNRISTPSASACVFTLGCTPTLNPITTAPLATANSTSLALISPVDCSKKRKATVSWGNCWSTSLIASTDPCKPNVTN